METASWLETYIIGLITGVVCVLIILFIKKYFNEH